jgi:hypothetical protein
MSGCSVSGHSFFQDDRLELISPEDRSQVRLPVTVRWRADDRDVRPVNGAFGVLVDRAPPPPGRTLAWLFRDDENCEDTAGCPDAAYLAERRVFETTGTSVAIDRVFATGDADRELHEVTVVLLDAQHRRVSESAWTVRFRIGEES